VIELLYDSDITSSPSPIFLQQEGQKCKIWPKCDETSTQIFRPPSCNFYRRKCDIWPLFLTTVNFNALWFRNTSTYIKSKSCIASDSDSCISSRNWYTWLPLIPLLLRNERYSIASMKTRPCKLIKSSIVQPHIEPLYWNLTFWCNLCPRRWMHC